MDASLIRARCTLTDDDALQQANEWRRVLDASLVIDTMGPTAVIDFPLEFADAVEDLADREATCCAFLSIATTRRSDSLRLEITAPGVELDVLLAAMTHHNGTAAC